MSKKIFVFFACIMLAVLLCACGSGTDKVNGRGITKDVKIGDWQSERYSDEELNAAVKAVLSAFEKEFGGCRMTDILYAGDEAGEEAGNGLSYDDVVLFETVFYAESAAEGSFANGTSYLGWPWVLGRSGGGAWEIVGNGY